MSIHVSEVTPAALMIGIPLVLFLIAYIMDYREKSNSKDKAVKAQASKTPIIILSVLIAIVVFMWFFALKTDAGKKMFKNFIHK